MVIHFIVHLHHWPAADQYIEIGKYLNLLRSRVVNVGDQSGDKMVALRE
jgi:hypothetical protein